MYRVLVVCVALSTVVIALAAPAKKATPATEARKQPAHEAKGGGGWQLSIQTYTFHEGTFLEALAKAREVGVKYLEGFTWQKIGSPHGDAELNFNAPAEALKAVQNELSGAHVTLVNCYVRDFGKDEAEAKKFFEFGKHMGIKTFVSEPSPEQLIFLDKLAQEYKIRIAIHNHPRNPKDEHYTNWDPDQVMKTIKDRSKFIGCCADTGHWARSKLDPVECLKKYEGRLICLHLKDVDEKGSDVPFGTGLSNVKGQLEELRRQKFSGVISIEYENPEHDKMKDVRECVAFYKQVAGELGE